MFFIYHYYGTINIPLFMCVINSVPARDHRTEEVTINQWATFSSGYDWYSSPWKMMAKIDGLPFAIKW